MKKNYKSPKVIMGKGVLRMSLLAGSTTTKPTEEYNPEPGKEPIEADARPRSNRENLLNI